ncbi:ABC transporter permease subunit [Microbacterium sp. R86528]|uniref:ABC transporter permease subunit n=1 Tax=Microbacterium sp. R86528 TaxID=3093864 RepID=UPI0037C982DA
MLVVAVAAPTAFVVLGGLVSMLLQSLGLMPLVGTAALSVEAYSNAAGDLPQSAAVSLGIAAASTLIAILVGGAAALLITSGSWSSKVVVAAGAVTVTVPHLIGAAAIGLLLADSGVLARALSIPTEAWPSFVGGPWWGAVIIEYAWKESAFVALVVAGTLITRVADFDETAALLGAGRRTRLRLVWLPLATPALIISGAITFVYTLGSYEVAWLLGRTYPEPLSVMAVRLYNDANLAARDEAAAVALTAVALAAVAGGIAFALLRRSAVWR